MALVAVLLAQRPEGESDGTPTAQPDPIWTVASSDIVGLIVEDLRQAEVIELARDEEDLWRVVRPTSMPAEASRVERAVSWLASPAPRAELFEAIDLAAFELDDPHYRVEVETRSGDRFTLAVGREAPTGGSRYATSEGRPGVLVISTLGLDEVLNLGADLLATEASPSPTLESATDESEETPEAPTDEGGGDPTESSTTTPEIRLEEERGIRSPAVSSRINLPFEG